MEHQTISKNIDFIEWNKCSKFVTRKRNIVNDQSNGNCIVGNEIIYSAELLQPNL